jgi:hypothetical protein
MAGGAAAGQDHRHGVITRFVDARVTATHTAVDPRDTHP